MRIYDCSNSSERPHHRGGGGPLENTVVSLLKKRAGLYGAEFINSPDGADIIFTNDIFPRDILHHSGKFVKRMDGIFWQEESQMRNAQYVEAAQRADLVIFISKYSRKCYERDVRLPLKRSTVVLNWVDEDIFRAEDRPLASRPIEVVCSATAWKREEKRGYTILWLAERFPNVQFHLVGKAISQASYPANITWEDYVSSPGQLAAILCSMDGFINLSHRDAAPKVVAEAICCGLPVMYAASGGVPEFFDGRAVGLPVEDQERNPIVGTPDLDQPLLLRKFASFIQELPVQGYNARVISRINHGVREGVLVSGYFAAMNQLLQEKK